MKRESGSPDSCDWPRHAAPRGRLRAPGAAKPRCGAGSSGQMAMMVAVMLPGQVRSALSSGHIYCITRARKASSAVHHSHLSFLYLHSFFALALACACTSTCTHGATRRSTRPARRRRGPGPVRRLVCRILCELLARDRARDGLQRIDTNGDVEVVKFRSAARILLE